MTDLQDKPTTFDISFRTRGSDTVARQLLSVWREAGKIDADNETDLSSFAFVLSVTNGADIGSLTERIPATQNFMDWFAGQRDSKGLLIGLTDERCLEILERFDEEVPMVFFYNVWLQAYNQSQVLFPSVKTIAPEATLTDAEREDEDLKKRGLSIGNA